MVGVWVLVVIVGGVLSVVIVGGAWEVVVDEREARGVARLSLVRVDVREGVVSPRR